MWHHKLSSMPRWVSFSNAPSLISLNSLSYSCLQYDTSVFFKSFAELLTDRKVYVHELQTTLKCSQQPKTVWGRESVGDSLCCYTILPQPFLVLYLSSCLKGVYLPRPPGVWGRDKIGCWGVSSEPSASQTIWNPGTTGSGPWPLPQEGGKGIVEGSKRCRWKRGRELSRGEGER